MEANRERDQSLFLEVFEALPRQGPGSRDCAARALRLCHALPSEPAILDLGCGVGAQTLHLAELTSGTIVAVDRHAPNIARLEATVGARGLARRIRVQVGDMARLELASGSFDLVWSEGALYNIGIANALRVCQRLLRPGGYVAFTDAVWRQPDAPPAVRALFAADYPTMGTVADVLDLIRDGGFDLSGHFPLPDAAWWTDFYAPMEQRIAELRGKYAGDAEALSLLDRIAEEPRLHRAHGHCYGYEFFVARRPPATAADAWHRAPA